MSTTVIDIADGLTTLINAWPQLAGRFNAERTVLPIFTPEELQKLRVTVLAVDAPAEITTRSNGIEEDLIIDVLVQKRIDPKRINAESKPLVQLAQDISDYVRTAANMRAVVGASLTKLQLMALYAPEHLRTNAIFTTATRFTFQRSRE